MPRHQRGRARTVGSSPEKSSPNCAELISTDPAPSILGQRNPPFSSRLLQIQNPVPSKKIKLKPIAPTVGERENRAPIGSWPKLSFTIPYSPSSPLRMSTGSTPKPHRPRAPKAQHPLRSAVTSAPSLSAPILVGTRKIVPSAKTTSIRSPSTSGIFIRTGTSRACGRGRSSPFTSVTHRRSVHSLIPILSA